jgi:hypothetical protein
MLETVCGASVLRREELATFICEAVEHMERELYIINNPW